VSRPHAIIVLIALQIVIAGRSVLAITIDDFAAGPFSIEVVRSETESTTVSGLPPDHTLGGSRYVTLRGSGPSPQSSVRVTVDTAAGEFRYNADPGATAVNFVVRYGHTSSLQANLLSDGANALVFDFAFANFESGGGNFDIVVDTEPGSRYLYVPVSNSSSPFSLVLPFRAFSTGRSGANFANVSSISFGTGNGNLRGDFTLNEIRTDFFPEGDYNFDRAVDELDYLLWSSHFGNGGPYWSAYPVHPADGNRDGIVNGADYLLWRKSRDAYAGEAGMSAVPEPRVPVQVLLTVCASIAFGLSKRRQLKTHK
jgi:hypothetical protein